MHHAYLVVGNVDSASEFMRSLCKENGVMLKGSPDYFAYSEPLFGIGEAREVSDYALRRAFAGKKIFFIAPERITLEAQNALLKTFEEPIADTHFFLVVREEELVLPTLRSRMQVTRVESVIDGQRAQEFMNMPIKKRMSFVKKFVDDEKNISAFLDELLSFLRGKSLPVETIERVYKVRLMSDTRAASPRLMLEHLALVL